MNEGKDNWKDKSSFLFDVLKRYDHYVATTNFKVALMMSFIGAIILGITIRVMSIESAQGECNNLYYSVIIFSSLTIIFSLITAINLLRAIFPNTKTHDGKKSLIFFGDVASCEKGVDGYKEKIEEATYESLLEDLSKQTFIMAEIINEKFRVLKLSVRIIIYAVIPLLTISLMLLIFKGVM